MAERDQDSSWGDAKRIAMEKLIRENLEYYAEEAGVTKSDIAHAVGVTPGAVGKWFSGETTISVQNVKPVCEFLGIPMHALLGESSMIAKMGRTRRRVHAAMDQLDEVGQVKLLDYAQDLLASGLYNPDDD